MKEKRREEESKRKMVLADFFVSEKFPHTIGTKKNKKERKKENVRRKIRKKEKGNCQCNQ